MKGGPRGIILYWEWIETEKKDKQKYEVLNAFLPQSLIARQVVLWVPAPYPVTQG